MSHCSTGYLEPIGGANASIRSYSRCQNMLTWKSFILERRKKQKNGWNISEQKIGQKKERNENRTSHSALFYLIPLPNSVKI